MSSLWPSETIVSSSASLWSLSCGGLTKDWSILMILGCRQREVGERGVPGAEVVERDADPEAIEALDHAQRLGDVEQRHALGDLEDESLWRQVHSS